MTKLILAAMFAAFIMPGTAVAKGPKHCPPGLAKKSPACVPPGQAKKNVRSDDRDRHDYRDHDEARDRDRDEWHDRYGDRADEYRVLRVGDRVIFQGEEYIVVRTGDRTVLRRGDDWYHLPRADDGSEYVRIGNAILKVDQKTKAVFQIIELADLILN